MACPSSTMRRGYARHAACYLRPSEGRRSMEWIILVVLIVLLLAAVGPRAGYYGTASPLFDVLSLIIVIGLILWLLDLFGVINVFG